MQIKDLINFIDNLGYKAKVAKKTNIVDKLLGKFEWTEEKTSTQVLKELRKSGYGKY
ncbi:hypothetical protein [Athalassotoga saccharophila]|uniref:hypothetical protein n=1 Tax=Athalassotoga saccharophila TaxID=1441386 RepID=UPI001E4BE38B|nr:hypothetical protein [Athalassotoga saccharophila]BBJ28372.1 hypothetical protein ATHSA_1285 [Athalassotoga saccharophila]